MVTDWACSQALCVSGVEVTGMDDWRLLLITVALFVSVREDTHFTGVYSCHS